MVRIFKGESPWPMKSPSEQRVHVDAPDAANMVAEAIQNGARALRKGKSDMIVVCIGTDRSTGDSFGPLVGTQLSESSAGVFRVLGTVDNPVHASNLVDTLEWIKASHPTAFVVAVDACLGRSESVGMLTVGHGPVSPGAGVNKILPPVGQIHLTGVVNVGGFMEYIVLQNTRLSLVLRMARVAAKGIALGLAAVRDRQHSAEDL